MTQSKVPVTTGYTQQNKVKLIHGGKEYFDVILEMINKAKDNIHLQTYIYDDDETGIMVADALKAAATRGVKVYMITDGYASQVMSHKFISELKSAGIHFRFFEPLFKSKRFYFGRRLHHKVVVADMQYALVGGINISDRYNDMPGKPAWLDFGLLVEGQIARDLCVLCWKVWYGFKKGMGLTPCEEKEISYNIKQDESSKVRMRRNDWVRRKNEISYTYLQMFRTAKKEIIILCSYFLPGREIKKAIVAANQRGVKVKVIATGSSDVKLAKYAERYMYDWLLRNQVELYEYEKNVLHGKIAVCDEQWMTIGSYNLNDISAHASIELNLDVQDTSFAQGVKSTLEQIMMNDCVNITAERHTRSKNIFKQFARWLSYLAFRFILFLFTFYFKQED